MSQEPRNMPVEGNWYPQHFLNLVFVPSVQVGHRGHFLFCLPPTSDDHIFRVRTPFGVFLNFMEIPLSQNYFHVPVEGIGFPQPCLKSMFCTKCVGDLVVSM